MPTPSRRLRIHVFGHKDAQVEEVASAFGGKTQPAEISECDLAIFAINPSHGIDSATIETWENLNDSLVPRLIVVTGLENRQADFDDAVLLANRVLDQTVTPFLVLHDDAGIACALISLEDLKIRNYETSPPTVSESDNEHKALVAEFRNEFLGDMEMMGSDAFAAGLLFPAIPLWISKKIGVDIVHSYIDQLSPSGG